VPTASTPTTITATTATVASAPTDTTSPRTIATRPLPSDARPVPLVVQGASAPAGAQAAALAASSPARGREGRPVPPRDGEPNTLANTDGEARQRAPQTAREPNVAARPVPTFTPIGPRTASEVCASRAFLAHAICMDRECERPIFRDQADCKKVIEVKRRRENQ
jgi:hypothetical protein